MNKNWGKGIEPPDFTTKEEVKVMIDDAIRRHNRNAGMILSLIHISEPTRP